MKPSPIRTTWARDDIYDCMVLRSVQGLEYTRERDGIEGGEGRGRGGREAGREREAGRSAREVTEGEKERDSVEDRGADSKRQGTEMSRGWYREKRSN